MKVFARRFGKFLIVPNVQLIEEMLQVLNKTTKNIK
jgi:hypothetical protein